MSHSFSGLVPGVPSRGLRQTGRRCLLWGCLLGLFSGVGLSGIFSEPVIAAPSSKLGFTVKSLQPSTSIVISEIVGSWSGGYLSFGKVTGQCSAFRGSGGQHFLKVGAKGKCRVTVNQSSSPKYPSAQISRRFKIVDTRTARMALIRAIQLPRDRAVKSRVWNHNGRGRTTVVYLGIGEDVRQFPWEQVLKGISPSLGYGPERYDAELKNLEECRSAEWAGSSYETLESGECDSFFGSLYWYNADEDDDLNRSKMWLKIYIRYQCISHPETLNLDFCFSKGKFAVEIQIYN